MNAFGLRRQAQRDAAFGPSKKRRRAALAAAIQNGPASSSALCHSVTEFGFSSRHLLQNDLANILFAQFADAIAKLGRSFEFLPVNGSL